MTGSHIVGSDGEAPRRRIDAREAAVATLSSLTVLALMLMAWRLVPLLLLIFGAALVAIFLRSLVEWTARWADLSYGWSFALVLSILGALGGAGTFFGGQMIANQMADLTDRIPQSLEKLREDVGRYPWGKRLTKAIPSSPEEIPVERKAAASYATEVVYSASGAVAAVLVMFVLALYMAVDPEKHVEGVVRLAPGSRRERIRDVLGDVHQALRWWLLGKMLAMAIVGALTSIGLAALGVPLAAALGVIAALLTFVPNFGPVISAVPALLLGFVQSPATAGYVALLYLAIQTVESYLITPLIQQRTVSLPPVLTISAQAGMGILFGAAGVLLASPIAAAAVAAFNSLYEKDSL